MTGAGLLSRWTTAPWSLGNESTQILPGKEAHGGDSTCMIPGWQRQGQHPGTGHLSPGQKQDVGGTGRCI